MTLLSQLWNDESGAILCAEAVVVGTVGVVGATVGISMAATAVNEELTDIAFAIRSLDQSYSVRGYCTPYAWTAGSTFIQEDVDIAIGRMIRETEEDAEAAEERLRRYHEQRRLRRPRSQPDPFGEPVGPAELPPPAPPAVDTI